MVQKIEIIRCTTNTIQVSVSDASGIPYNLGVDEKIVFGLKVKPGDEDLLLVKTATPLGAGQFQIVLCPEDTEALAPGRYSYDVGLDTGADFFNVIEPSPFVIEANVTCRGCAK
jgi:hypothetical protein